MGDFTLGLTGDRPFRVQLLACLGYAAGWIAVGALGVVAGRRHRTDDEGCVNGGLSTI